MENLLSILPVLATDLSLTDFTFWIGFAAMLASTMFFFSAMNMVADKWKTSMLVSALITGIAALHYYYMRNAAMEGDITTAYRYVDWILTVRSSLWTCSATRARRCCPRSPAASRAAAACPSWALGKPRSCADHRA